MCKISGAWQGCGCLPSARALTDSMSLSGCSFTQLEAGEYVNINEGMLKMHVLIQHVFIWLLPYTGFPVTIVKVPKQGNTLSLCWWHLIIRGLTHGDQEQVRKLLFSTVSGLRFVVWCGLYSLPRCHFNAFYVSLHLYYIVLSHTFSVVLFVSEKANFPEGTFLVGINKIIIELKWVRNLTTFNN